MTNYFQVEFFSFNYQKQWNLSVCKKSLTKLDWTDYKRLRETDEEEKPVERLALSEMEDGTNGDWELREDQAVYLNE